MNEQLQQLRVQKDTKLRQVLETQGRPKISQATVDQIKRPLKERIFDLIWTPLWNRLVRQPEVSIKNQIYHQLKQDI